MKRARVHIDDTQAGQPMRVALCGWLSVETTESIDLVTCRSCLAVARGERPKPRTNTDTRTFLDFPAFVRDLHLALPLEPKAGSPPVLDARTWSGTCKGAEHRRCGECVLCLHEREIDKWHHASPWNKEHHIARDANATRWGSLDSALRAYVQHEQTGRDLQSSLGGVLARAARHDVGRTARNSEHLSREFDRGLDVVPVALALERAYAGGHAGLASSDCIRILLERTDGILPARTTYEELYHRYHIGPDSLKGLVMLGRRKMTEELAARGVIPPPRNRNTQVTSPRENVHV